MWGAELVKDRAEIAAMAWLCSGGVALLNASALTASVLTMGDEAAATDPERIALGGLSGVGARVSTLVDEPLAFVSWRLTADLAAFRAKMELGGDDSTTGRLRLFSNSGNEAIASECSDSRLESSSTSSFWAAAIPGSSLWGAGAVLSSAQIPPLQKLVFGLEERNIVPVWYHQALRDNLFDSILDLSKDEGIGNLSQTDDGFY